MSLSAAELHAEYARLLREFQAKGLGGNVGFGERPALLVIDMTPAFTDPRSPLAGELEPQIAAIQKLLAAARAGRVPVIFTTVAYAADLQDAGVWIRKMPVNRELLAGSQWVEIDPRLGRRPGEMLLVKKYASAFFGTDLVSRLQAQRVDTVILTGTSTSGCVRATAVDACSYGFHTVVVKEAVGDRALLPHLASLFDIQAKYGDVLGVVEVENYIGRRSQPEHDPPTAAPRG